MSRQIFPLKPQFFSELERIVSEERLNRYVRACSGDIHLAWKLYEDNIEVSEALFGILHILEVSLRNSIHTEMKVPFTDSWLYGEIQIPWLPLGNVLTWSRPMVRMVDKARDAAGQDAPVGKVIAELSFGFWPSLLTRNFHAALWTRCLHRAFPNIDVPRHRLHLRLETIRHLRNRIAHHEPIITSNRQLYTGYRDCAFLSLDEIIECSHWISAASAEWQIERSRYRKAQTLLNEIAVAGYPI